MLTDAQVERWSRQILLAEVGGRGQERLLAARVAVLGSGPAVGVAADLLERAGVGVADDPAGAALLLDLDGPPAARAERARRALADGVPLVRGDQDGARITVSTLVGAPCGLCAGTAAGSTPAGVLAGLATRALGALAAAEALRALLDRPAHGRRQQLDLSAGRFTGEPLETAPCGACGSGR